MDFSISGETVVAQSGARVMNVSVLSDGALHLSGGSAVSALVSSGGTMRIYQRSVARGGRVLRGGLQTIHSGGAASAMHISSGGRQVVSAGARSVGFAIHAGGTQTIMSGGSGSNGRIYASGRQIIYSGARVASMRIQGVQTLAGGATTLRMAVSSGGSQVVGASCIASETSLQRGARQTVLGGGSAIGATVMTGATQYASGSFDMAVVSRTTVQGGASQLLRGAISVSTYLRGRQFVSNGYARYDRIGSGGSQVLRRGAEAQECHVSSGGRQILSSGAISVDCAIWRGGYQIVSRGGEVYGVFLANGARQRLHGGVVYRTSLGVGAIQEVISGGSAFETVFRGGSQIIYAGGATGDAVITSGRQILVSGGSAVNAEISADGRQLVSSGGLASAAVIHMGGQQIVLTGGSAVSTFMDGGTQIISGGRVVRATLEYASQIVAARGRSASARIMGGAQTLEYRGSSLGDVFSTGASQIISAGAVASRAGIYFSAVQVISGSGSAWGTILRNRGAQTVLSGGVARLSYVRFGGSAIVSDGGMLNSARVSSGGYLRLQGGASAGNLNTSSGAVMHATGMTRIHGVNNISGTRATGNGVFALTSGATLRLRSGNALNVTINGPGASVHVSGKNNSISGMDGAAAMYFTVRNVTPGATSMISFNNTAAQPRRFGMFLNTWQQFGTYTLARNMSVASGVSFAVSVSDGRSFGLRVNGQSYSRNGITYSLRTSGNQTRLTVSGRAGNIVRGASGAARGTSRCDIFYGAGGGNASISGGGGNDVVVYDNTNWGKDVIEATSGRVTLYFAGVKSSDVTRTRSGSDMILTRKSDTAQSITVRNWSSASHVLKFGGTLGQFSSYLAAATPTAAQATSARNEVWKKAGLLA